MQRVTWLFFLTACAAPAEGLRATPAGDGPLVLVDWEAEPLPELPLPNDLATVPDATSVTGLRVNIPLMAKTLYESEARAKINALTGWGLYAPISVSFDGPLDVQNILDRHPDDLHLDTTFDDDAFLVIDVDPDSPYFGQAAHLDVGHGRFPLDAFQTDRYFANDTRAASPSILFDTVDEDLNGNGVLDPGEDTDNDGLLDVPNVWPPGGDPFEDLLTFYDLTENMLQFRPVVPLREETTYAVVLTDRLTDAAGNPIRSPWPFVHHTRQTSALAPLEDILPDYGLTLDNVAYAWTFTTARVTGDLIDLRRGLFEAKGPWPYLAAQYPPRLDEALQVNGRTGDDPYQLPISALLTVAGPLGLVGDGAGADLLINGYRGFADRLVGGSFTTPYLMADFDDGGFWDADEWFKTEPLAGTLWVQPARVPFTCVLPKPREGVQPPFDVLMYGHGYGSSRLEVLLFASVMSRFGFAVCGMDSPGHGPTLRPDDLEVARVLLEGQGLLPLLDQTFDSRHRDLNNDGATESGGDQWSADPFHTRDMVRQQVVDWMQFIRLLRACGTETMELTDYDADGRPVRTGATRVACDWDDDGVADLGGPDASLNLLGGSLGGINVGVAAAVLPGITAFSPVVPGAGIVDVGVRTRIGGAVEAFVGKFINPIFVGLPDEEGVRVVQLCTSVTDMVELPIGRLDAIPEGGSIRISNLGTGEVVEGVLPEDGRFRLHIAADALDPFEKRVASGMPKTGPEPGVVYEVPDNEGLGDPIVVEVLDAEGEVVQTFDTWAEDVTFEGVTMRAGSPLVAGTEGNGKIRGSKDARRLAYIAGMAIEPGDPIAYGRHWFEEPFEAFGSVPQNVLMVPTPGDDQVPINGGISLARASGIVDWRTVDPRYGQTVDQWLIERQVIRGSEERGPWTCRDGSSCLFDADDLDNGTDQYDAPSDAPLRATVETSVGVSGMRLPYVDPRGTHGFREPDPNLEFDIHTFAIHQIVAYFLDKGQRIDDRPCLATADCPEFPPFPEVE